MIVKLVPNLADPAGLIGAVEILTYSDGYIKAVEPPKEIIQLDCKLSKKLLDLISEVSSVQ